MSRLLLAAALALVGGAGPGLGAAQAVSLDARPLPEGNALVRSMVERQRSFEKAMDDYTYDNLVTETKLDAGGKAKESHVRRYQVFYVAGRPVQRLVAEDGRPLPAERAEQELKRALEAAEKARRRPRTDEQRQGGELRLSRILDRFDFTSVARQSIGGRTAVVVTLRPLPGKRDLKYDNVLRALQGRLFIDEAERAIVRAELSTKEKVKIGAGFLASLSNVDLSIDFVPVDDIWLPRRSEAFAAGRLLLLKSLRQRVTQEFSNYRRFEVSSNETVTAPAGSGSQ